MKKIWRALGAAMVLALVFLTACNESAVVSSAGSSTGGKATPVLPNGQYTNEDGLLELPGMAGTVEGDGNIPALLSRKEYEELCNTNGLGLPNEAFADNGEYEVTVWPSEATGVAAPRGILVRENDLLVADGQSGRIAVLDKEGNLIKTVGEIGNGEKEFLRPSAILNFEGNIHVLDGGNDRIQVLNERLEFQQSFQLIRPSEYGDFYNFAYDQAGDLYLSRMEVNSQRLYCYPRGQKGEPTPIGENCCAALAEKEGKVYALNFGTSYTEGPVPEDPHIFVEGGMGSGNNYLFSAQPTQMTKIAELPFGVSGSSLLAAQDGFLVFSESVGRLLQFDAEGIFEKTIAEIPLQSHLSSYLAQGEDGTVYVTGEGNSNIYVISRRQDQG